MAQNTLILLFILTKTGLVLLAPIPITMVDLSYVFNNDTLYWPEDSKFKVKVVFNGSVDGYWMQTEEFSSTTHAGTHMDAPCHFAKGGWCIDDIPIERFVVPAAIIDITEKAEKDRDALVSVSDLQSWEKQFDASLNGTLVIMRSGWGKRWGNRESYTGTPDYNVSRLHFPGIGKDAATFLANKRRIVGVAVDTLSLDNGPSTNFSAHQILLGKSIYGIENLANLDKLPQYGATIHAFPMKMGKGSGAPVRVIATFPRINFGKHGKKLESGLREIIIFNK